MELKGKFTQIFSANGQDYYGIDISPADINIFNNFLRLQCLDEQFIINKQKRDSGHYHITVLNPMVTNKYRNDDKVKSFIHKYLNQDISVQCNGIGFVSKTDKDILKSAWFSVCENHDLSKELASLNIFQDLHITLAFNPSDVFQVRKNNDSILYSMEHIQDTVSSQNAFAPKIKGKF